MPPRRVSLVHGGGGGGGGVPTHQGGGGAVALSGRGSAAKTRTPSNYDLRSFLLEQEERRLRDALPPIPPPLFPRRRRPQGGMASPTSTAAGPHPEASAPASPQRSDAAAPSSAQAPVAARAAAAAASSAAISGTGTASGGGAESGLWVGDGLQSPEVARRLRAFRRPVHVFDPDANRTDLDEVFYKPSPPPHTPTSEGAGSRPQSRQRAADPAGRASARGCNTKHSGAVGDSGSTNTNTNSGTGSPPQPPGFAFATLNASQRAAAQRHSAAREARAHHRRFLFGREFVVEDELPQWHVLLGDELYQKEVDARALLQAKYSLQQQQQLENSNSKGSTRRRGGTSRTARSRVGVEAPPSKPLDNAVQVNSGSTKATRAQEARGHIATTTTTTTSCSNGGSGGVPPVPSVATDTTAAAVQLLRSVGLDAQHPQGTALSPAAPGKRRRKQAGSTNSCFRPKQRSNDASMRSVPMSSSLMALVAGKELDDNDGGRGSSGAGAGAEAEASF